MSLLVYKSSAGSGKTFTLVREYLKLALGTKDPMVFSNILAITFTNKAATEMTDRILETLEEMGGLKSPIQGRTKFLMKLLVTDLGITEKELSLRARKTLKKIVHNYRDFSVGTIDSFVHRIIRSFATEMGLNQQFEVELNTESILKRAVDLMLDRVGVDKLLTQFIEQYVDSKFEEGTTWKIDEDLFNFSKGLLKTHEWYYLNKAKSISLEKYAEIYSDLLPEIKKYENYLLAISKRAMKIAQDGIEMKCYAYSGGMFGYFKKVLDKNFHLEHSSRVEKYKDESSKWYSAKANKDDKLVIDSKKQELIPIMLEFDKYREIHEDQYVFNSLLASNIYGVALLSEIDKYVQKIKKENDLVLISDFTELVGEITRNEAIPFIFEKLGERYSHFLFDEFQDTSLMQWHNMLPLVEESLSKNGTSMVVGDAKQSIYRWRGGVVEQFEQLPEVYNPYNDQFVEERKDILLRSNQEVEPLNTNYRSFKNVVDFNNLFFKNTANRFGGSAEKFYFDVEQKVQNQEDLGLVKFNFFSGKVDEAAVEVFAEIASTISSVKREGYNLRDIAILTKTKKDTPALVEYLNGNGIDVISSESLLVSNSKAVKLVVSVLKFINYPGEQFYSADLLIKLNQVFSKASFHEVIANPESLSNEKLIHLLQNWGYAFNPSEILAFPIYEMVSTIIEIFGLHKLNDNRLASWTDYVFEKSKKVGFGLYDLLDDWKGQEDILSIQIPEDVDAVNVMTIHKSKGLDWPIVIVAQGNWSKKNNKHKIWVNVKDENPIPVILLPTNKRVETSVFKKEYEAEMERIQIDNFNAMYVAFTRPAERLYVMTVNPEKNFFGDVFPSLLEMEGNEKVTFKYKEVKGKKVLGSLSYGNTATLVKEEESITEENNLIYLSNNKNSFYREKLKVKKNYLKRMNDSGELDYGNLVHKAFSYIESSTDVSLAIDKMVGSGEIMPNDAKPITHLINQVIKDPRLQQYFVPGLVVKNEEDIVLSNGEFLRPDRVVIDGDNACVIDFKTGMRKPEHDKQILSYKLQLINMGYQNVKALLVYTTDVEVVEV
ncbi:MAG: UvrD-helicase domain-containing protein [Salibacteraceae bacterium]